MKTSILSQIKGSILNAKEQKTIIGGYNGSFTGDCSFICCSGNQGAKVSKAGCNSSNLYIYNPNPSLYCVSTC